MIDKIDKYHTPNIGLYNLSEISDALSIKNSENDTSKRKFSITLYLEDVRSRTPHVFFTFDGNLDFHILDQEGDHVNFFLLKNELNNYINRIMIDVEKNTILDVMNSIKSIFPTLSFISYKFRRSLNIQDIRIKDLKHSAEFGILQLSSVPVKIINIPYGSLSLETPIGSMFSLYRAGMNSLDEPYRFLCFFKILEAYSKGKTPFSSKLQRPKIILTKELLNESYIPYYHDCFLNLNIKKIYSNLLDYRDMIAHPIKDRKAKDSSFFNFDCLNHIAHIGARVAMLYCIATKILDTEMELLAFHDPEIRKFLDGWNKTENG